MSRIAALVVAWFVLLPPAAPARAAEWGTIVPGTSTTDSVRAQYGQPTKSQAQQVEGYDTTQWVYEGVQAPAGIVRLTVDFGLLTAAGYKKDVVRSFRLDPKPGVFNRTLVMDGWGTPTRIGRDGEFEVFLYEHGLLVYFDKEGRIAQALIFTPPQPLPAAPAQR
ncbi:MAG: hypothetical protein HYU25_16680 [Candidatus Rokubacteria bacterium]|nr:hypothetical protein [Candidatus Rokubacteria bacterium]